MALCDLDRVAARRRKNFQRWVDAVGDLPHCRSLVEQLPDDAVPYMFPLLIEHPQDHFPLLKRLGVTIWRWDDMAESPCAVSRHYRQHLLHLPCHQALSDNELSWMETAVAKVVRSPRNCREQGNRMTGSTP